MTVADHVRAFNFYLWLSRIDADYGYLHLKSGDAVRAMKSDMVNDRTYEAWPRGIWIGWKK